MHHPKPHLLLLHGGGTSSQIFRFQTRKLSALLSSHFTLHYLDGPFLSSPGPGVLPVFEGMDPYYRWRKRLLRDDAATMSEQEWEEWERDEKFVDELLDRVLKGMGGGDATRGGEEGFVGVVGFSQGAGLAARLLYRQQQRREHEGPGRVPGEDLRFGVFVCGTAECLYSRSRLPPPASSTIGTGAVAVGASEREKGSSDIRSHEVIRTRTIHVHGVTDPLLPQSRVLLKQFCDVKVATVIEFDGGHHMPLAKGDNERLAELILRAASE